MSADSSPTENLKLVYDHAWNWFSHHAEQRMTALRFFLIVIGIFAVGYYQSLSNKLYLLASLFSMLACCFAILFWRLDLRTRELIKVGEDLLSQTEAEMGKFSTIQAHIVTDVDTKRSKHVTKFMPNTLYTYGQIFSAIFSLSFLFWLAAIFYTLLEGGVFQMIKNKICAS